MLIEIKKLVVNYGGVAAIKGVSLDVQEGTVVTLIGANGAGKTTLLKTISGLIRPKAGEIWYRGKRIDGLEPQEIVKRGICHVPESRGLFPDLTVVSNLTLGAYLRKDKQDIKTDLEEIYKHFPILSRRKKQEAGTLSGGEQQMLAIGRALMARPRVLLMDEPSLGLAPLIVEEIAEIIQKINEDLGVSLVLVEQNAYMALSLAHMAYVMETGEVVLKGRNLLEDEHVKEAYLGG
jgi:branched-chain amino acid transport system ATP-binding protein